MNSTDDSNRETPRHLARIQRAMLLLGLGLVLLGTGLELVQRGHIAHSTVALNELAVRLWGLQSDAVLTSGLLVLLSAPATGLAYLIFAFLGAKDRLHALLAFIVFSILVASVLLKGLG